jgi:predicted nicotinamide N-methyase
MATIPEQTHAAFVRAHTVLAKAPLVPEISLFLAQEDTPLWLATAAWLDEREVPPPFWAFAWPGGQALARWLLDAAEPEAQVLDLGCGGGLAAIAACVRGAKRARAVDSDPFARAAACLNAESNGVVLEVDDDVAREAARSAETPITILAADVFYDRATSDFFLAVLSAARRAGARVLASDPRRPYFPRAEFRLLASYETTTPVGLEREPKLMADVYEML